MDDCLIGEEEIRSYLLGRIGADEKLSAAIDMRMLADPEFSMLIDVIEDEIIEDYIDGELSAAEVEAMESHFLQPPERQSKLWRTRWISQQLRSAAGEMITATPKMPVRTDSPERGRVLIFRSVRTWTEIAAGLALVSCTIYFWNQQRELRLAVKQSGQEMAQLEQAQASGSITAKQAAVITLNLNVPGLSRGRKALPEVRLMPGAASLHISIALSARPAGPMNVQLKQGAVVIWSRDGVEARPVSGGAVLAVDLPTAVVPEGTCSLIVNAPDGGELSYWFKATIVQ